MRQNLSDQEFHALYCPIRNSKSALFLVALFSLTAFLSWKGLHNAPAHPNVVELLFAIIVVAMLTKWLVAFTCFRERLVFGLVIVSLIVGQVKDFLPSVFGQHVGMIKFGKLALSLLALIVSLTMLVQSVRSPNLRPSNVETSIVEKPNQNLPILLVVVLILLLLGTLLYLLPFRQ